MCMSIDVERITNNAYGLNYLSSCNVLLLVRALPRTSPSPAPIWQLPRLQITYMSYDENDNVCIAE